MNHEEMIEKAQAPTDHVKEAIYDGAEFVCATCPRNIYGAQVAWEHAHPAETEKAQAPTDDERETLPVASRDVWGWDTCVVCGSKEVSDRGMVIMGASNGAPYVARIAWCDQSQECREDLRQTSFLLTEPDVKVIDGFRRPAQTEPTDAQVNAAAKVFWDRMTREAPIEAMRAALKAAFTAGQEEPK